MTQLQTNIVTWIVRFMDAGAMASDQTFTALAKVADGAAFSAGKRPFRSASKLPY